MTTFFTTSSVFDSIDRAFSSNPCLWQVDQPRFRPTRPTVTLDDWRQFFSEHGLEDHSNAFDKAKQVYKDLPAFPASDVKLHREDGSLEFDLALPGYDMDDIDIAFEGDYMLITVRKENGLHKRSEGRDDVVVFRKGLRSSGLNLKLPVPQSHFKIREAKASYKNGILNILIPRSEDSAPVKLKLTE